MKHKVPIGVLLSGSGSNLQALIDACAQPEFPARIAVVVSNKKGAFGLQRARDAGIPSEWVPARPHPSREVHEQRITEVLEEHGVEWVLCAGYMRLLGPRFVGHWRHRVLNIHPGLLPAFPGVDAQQQAFHHGVQIAGVTVHLVNEGCDTGPILAQAATGVQPTDDAATLQARLLRMEHEIYPMVLQWAAEGRIEVHDSTASVDLPRNHTRFLWREPE